MSGAVEVLLKIAVGVLVVAVVAAVPLLFFSVVDLWRITLEDFRRYRAIRRGGR